MKCKTKHCRNNADKKEICYKCRSRKYREENPIKSAFQNHKTNAKRRGIESSLTFEEFKKFAIETNYIFGKGRSKESLHIDRIREEYGYHSWNIQVLTNSENVKKQHEDKRRKKVLDYSHDSNGVPYHFRFRNEYTGAAEDSNLPF